MFNTDWLILRILHQSFEIEIPKGHWSEVVVHLYQPYFFLFLAHLSHRYHVSFCGISPESKMFAMTKRPLGIHKEPSKVYCIKPERINKELNKGNRERERGNYDCQITNMFLKGCPLEANTAPKN